MARRVQRSHRVAYRHSSIRDGSGAKDNHKQAAVLPSARPVRPVPRPQRVGRQPTMEHRGEDDCTD